MRQGSLLVTVPNIMARPKIHWIAYFWPGLPQLWIRGSWAGLLVAVGFTTLANVLLLASLVFREWIDLKTRLMGFAALAVVWLLSRWQSRAQRRAIQVATAERDIAKEDATERPSAERDLMFREAQGHYLRNDWVAAEQSLLKLLKQDARDAESRLMLATLWRHQGRQAEALRQLERLGRLESATKWQHEIAAERMAIEELNSQANDELLDERSDAPQERTDEAATENTDRYQDQPRRAA